MDLAALEIKLRETDNWIIFVHIIVQGRKPDNYWNIDNCKKEASKYKSPKELKKNNYYVYVKLRKNNLLDDLFKK